MVNENALVESWFSDRLLGRATQVDPGTWTDVTEGYARDLTARYQAWLQERLTAAEIARLREEARVAPGADVPRLASRDFAGASALRLRTEAAFYVSLEERFFREMAAFLRDEVGVRAPLVYWQHPDYLPGRSASGQSLFRIPNTPMVDDPLHSTVAGALVLLRPDVRPAASAPRGSSRCAGDSRSGAWLRRGASSWPRCPRTGGRPTPRGRLRRLALRPRDGADGLVPGRDRALRRAAP